VPFFSIIIPAFNREAQLLRAVKSALAQEFESFEVIVVDDASTDKTLEVARGIIDPRMQIVARLINGGPCQARNAGVDVATGEWLVMLDSDFTFMPGALVQLHEWCQKAPRAVGNCISACAWDNGWLTPVPPPPETLDYTGYLQWCEQVTVSEYFNCIRRDVFRDVRYANSRAWETSFHLGLAKSWRLEFHPEPVVLVHTDAKNRLTTARGRSVYQRLLADAPDKVANFRVIFSEHSRALSALAPRTLVRLHREALKQACLAGLRLQAWRWFFASRALFNPRCLAFLLLGLVSPRLLALAHAYR